LAHIDLVAVATIARRELSERLRNRWIWTVSGLVLLTSLALGLLGATPVGVVGAGSGGAILASIVNLAVYLVPLLALVMGAGAVIEDKASGHLDLMLAYPVTAGEYFLGTFAGHMLALWLALLTSFVPACLILSRTSGVHLAESLGVLVPILGLGTSFLALSFLVAILAGDPARGIASSVLVWVFTVLVFDLVLVGMLVGLGDRIPPDWLGAALLLNPADVFRLIAFDWASSAASPLGLATVAPPFSVAVLAAIMALWIVLPLFLSHWLFQRRLAADVLV